jgi:hypothetical protein
MENQTVIWVIAAASGGSLGILIVRWWFPRAKRKPLTWDEILGAGTLDAITNMHELMRVFFLPDSINPPDFLGNFLELSEVEPGPSHAGASKPSPSATTFDKGVNAPAGYPNWFLAGYPDVVVWLASRGESAMLRISAEALYGVEGAKELVRLHGLQRIGELMDEHFEEFDLPQLRRLVTIFARDTKRPLECALIVKQQRPRWWSLFESSSKRVSIAT